jgi:hypothetical protein
MFKLLAAAFALAAVAVAPAAAKQVAFEPNDRGQIEFAMPSGNIGCLYTPEGGTDIYEPKGGGPELICERVEPAYVTVILGPEGEPDLIEDPGEQSCCGAQNILEYGDFVALEGFVCASDRTGLVCFRPDGQSFSMARAGIEFFVSDEGMNDEGPDEDGEAEDDEDSDDEKDDKKDD